MELPAFLEQVVEGYLLADLDSLQRAEPRADGHGACVYPMVMTTCAGIELLGKLSTGGDRAKGFTHYWSTYLYNNRSEHEGTVIYQAVRHGLAHLFLAKSNVQIRKSDGQHLAFNEDGRLCLNATQLATDFARSYWNRARAELIGPAARDAQQHLTRMLGDVGKPREDLLPGVHFPSVETPALTSRPSGMAQPRGPVRELVLNPDERDDD
jgi:hypothetical protein